MGYSLRIKRPENPISLDEWTRAIEAVDSLRLNDDSGSQLINPKTGEKMVLKSQQGDAEYFDTETGQWHGALMWHKSGSVSFNSRAVEEALNGEPDSDKFWQAVTKLAGILGASILGEEGELYDQVTARPGQG
ncbi:hypothetical protein [Roseibacillus persicicus]|uniref:hypothetical protein n=1 Tax=Roseibacillus persicicus TaxID=454148 RepID=UPI00280C49E1|nr:hypothetical protein [Roseibacillus persicicus]MDQ8192680.1 hypothetical protein [Roseibacillus persicicus]